MVRERGPNGFNFVNITWTVTNYMVKTSWTLEGAVSCKIMVVDSQIFISYMIIERRIQLLHFKSRVMGKVSGSVNICVHKGNSILVFS